MTERTLPIQHLATVQANERLIVALDVPTIEQARTLVEQLDGLISFFKIGLGLHLAAGLEGFIDFLLAKNKKVFIDFKYNDIGETVEKAVEQAAMRDITFVTVHGNGGMIRAAVKGRGHKSSPKIFIVTVLTSLDAVDIKDLGFPCSVERLVLHRAQSALDAGCDGVIASGREAQAIKKITQDRLLIVSPGIRPKGASSDDHKRAASPTEAIEAGADYLVVGRPIIHTPTPRHAAERILEEMRVAFDKRSQG